MNENVLGVIETPLKRIRHPDGDLYHAIKSTEEVYAGFGEAYFSSVLKGAIKGWKRHKVMVSNLVVPVGNITFYFYNSETGDSYKVLIGRENYARLTVPPGIWMAFEGGDEQLNLLLNIASIVHDPTEADSVPIDTFRLCGDPRS